MYALVKKNAEIIWDPDDGYHYNNPTTIKKDLYVKDYLTHVFQPDMAKLYKTKGAAERFKKKLMNYSANPDNSEYAEYEVIEVQEVRR